MFLNSAFRRVIDTRMNDGLFHEIRCDIRGLAETIELAGHARAEQPFDERNTKCQRRGLSRIEMDFRAEKLAGGRGAMRSVMMSHET